MPPGVQPEPETVLIIDDEPHARRIIEIHLRACGFKTISAKNAAQGMVLAKEQSPTLVLLDVMMPDVNGLELLYDLRNEERTKSLLVFMMTTQSMIDDIEKAFAIGADDYITKPFDPEKLGDVLKYKLKKRRAERGLTADLPSDEPIIDGE